MIYSERNLQRLIDYKNKHKLMNKKSSEEVITRSDEIDFLIDSEESYIRSKTGFESLFLAIYEDLGWINITEQSIEIKEFPKCPEEIPIGLEDKGGYKHSLLKWNAYLFLKSLNTNANPTFECSYSNYYLDVYDKENSIIVECCSEPALVSQFINKWSFILSDNVEEKNRQFY